MDMLEGVLKSRYGIEVVQFGWDTNAPNDQAACFSLQGTSGYLTLLKYACWK
jgi:hypothetical protein